MSTHDAEHFHQRRHKHGIPAPRPCLDSVVPQHGTELGRLEQLPWPRNSFGEYATIAQLLALPANRAQRSLRPSRQLA